MYRLMNVDGSEHYLDGTAEYILYALMRYGVRFIDTDGKALKVVLA